MDPIKWSRENPRTLVPAARALYERGLTRSQVLEAIYGVDLPPEAALFLRDFVSEEMTLQALWSTHPWELMIPLEEGGPAFEIGPIESAEEALAFAQAPHVIVLGCINYSGAPFGDSIFGYDIDELHAGRSTVVGLRGMIHIPKSGAQFTMFGSSMIDVFCEVIANYRKLTEQQIDAGIGGELVQDLAQMDYQLASVRALRGELTGAWSQRVSRLGRRT
jgi:hypothetical protein